MARPQPQGPSHVQDRLPPATEIARQYTQALRAYFGERLKAVVLYGSVARDEQTRESDIDLLIVIDGLPQSLRARSRLLVEFEEEFLPALLAPWHRQGMYIDVSTKVKTSEEAQQLTPFYLDMTEEAIILHERERFFQDILDRLRDRLAALGAQRRRQGRLRYWQLKPDYRWGEVIQL
jgi:predicted nucleotidyltransferase